MIVMTWLQNMLRLFIILICTFPSFCMFTALVHKKFRPETIGEMAHAARKIRKHSCRKRESEKRGVGKQQDGPVTLHRCEQQQSRA
jgi:hypothetical protein